MYHFKLSMLLISLFVSKACYPVSHVIVGEAKTPIDHTNVTVYIDYPENYEKIAIIEASSDLAFRDFSIDFTHQQKTNKALHRLKKEAGLLGANGVVVQNIATNIKQHLSLGEDNKGGINASSRHEKQKELIAIAIFVK